MSVAAPARGVGGLMQDMASATPHEPARPRCRGQRLFAAPQLRRDRPRQAQPRAPSSTSQSTSTSPCASATPSCSPPVTPLPTPRTPLDTAAMAPVRDAIDRLLAGHEPFPSIVVNRRWDLIAANKPAMAIMSEGRRRRAARASGQRHAPHPAPARPGPAHPQPRRSTATHLLSTASAARWRCHRTTVVEALVEELAGTTPASMDAAAPVPSTRRPMLFVPFCLRTGPATTSRSSVRWPRSAQPSTSRWPSSRSSPSFPPTRRPRPRCAPCSAERRTAAAPLAEQLVVGGVGLWCAASTRAA